MNWFYWTIKFIFYNEKIGASFFNEVPILVSYTHNHLIYRCDCDRRRIRTLTDGAEIRSSIH